MPLGGKGTRLGGARRLGAADLQAARVVVVGGEVTVEIRFAFGKPVPIVGVALGIVATLAARAPLNAVQLPGKGTGCPAPSPQIRT